MSEKYPERRTSKTYTYEAISEATGLEYASCELPLKGEDFVVTDHKRGIFAVFDGMGGVGAPGIAREASAYAATICTKTYHEADPNGTVGSDVQTEQLRMYEWMQQVDRTMSVELGRAGTTATVARTVKQNGKSHIVWGSVGDSRLYLYRDGELTLMTEDESVHGSALYNYLGGGNAHIKQIGSFQLKPRDRLMICSDGITGDTSEDVLTEAEMSSSLQYPTPRMVASSLIDKSKKVDDKSVVVVDYIGNGSEKNKSEWLEVRDVAAREYSLAPHETFTFNSSKPLFDMGGYLITAIIRVADIKLALLDLRKTAPNDHGKRQAFRHHSIDASVDFMLVDESFFESLKDRYRMPTGFKVIRAGESITFGRKHNTEILNFPLEVSRDHFCIDYSKDAEAISIINGNPRNGTSVIVHQDTP